MKYLLCVLGTLSWAILSEGPPALASRLDLAVEGFVRTSTGGFEQWIDSRDLLVMSHAWIPSVTGGYSQASLRVRTPKESSPPFRLQFYCSDDNFNDFWRAKNDSWLGGDGFCGHRFKQVWANGKLLWESDVIDANPPQASGRQVFDLGDGLRPGNEVEITLRVVDKIASEVVLASDTQHICDCETAAEKPGDAPKYWTHVYWGDLAILGAGEDPSPLEGPLAARVKEVHEKRWQVRPYGDGSLTLPFDFKLSVAAGLPEAGYPARCGVPIPSGMISEASELGFYRLEGGLENPVRADFEPVSTWPDGSLKWATVRFPTRTGDESKSFRVKKRSALEVSEEVAASTSQLDAVFYGQGIGLRLKSDSSRDFLRLTPELGFAQTGVVAGVDGPGGRFSNSGRFSEPGSFPSQIPGISWGRYEISAEVPRDLDLVGMDWTVFFEERSESSLDLLALAGEISLESPTSVFWSGGSASLALSEVTSGISLGEATPPAWVAVRDKEIVHFFAFRHADLSGETGFRLSPGLSPENPWEIVLECYRADQPESGYAYTPGEAKTFQVLYGRLGPDTTSEECDRLADQFDRPPLLVNPDLLSRSGAFGYSFAPREGQPGHELADFLKATTPDPLGASIDWGTTQRDFGDIRYSGPTSWRNGYYDYRQGFIAAYLLTGNRDWADAADRAAQHAIDVDTIWSSTDHPELVGLMHGYGEGHTSMEPWNPILRMNGILEAAHLWGNDRQRRVALDMAKRIAETGRALGAVSVRDHAGVMMSLAVAYRETRDPSIQEAADKLVEDIRTHRIDTRRGTYPEVHGNYNYRGNVPWMVAQLVEPLYLYYRESGNLEAAELVVGLCQSILCENQTRGVPGDIHGYSHNPHFAKNSGYHVLIAPSLFYAYELTGDETFREAAVAAWNQTVRENTINSVLNCFWNAPTLTFYLNQSGENSIP